MIAGFIGNGGSAEPEKVVLVLTLDRLATAATSM